MSGNWDDEEEEVEVSAPARLVPKSKWDDEEDSDTVLDSWDASDDEDKPKPVVAAPPKKTLKQKIAEREEAVRKAAEEKMKKLQLEQESLNDRRERLKKMQLQSDLDNAADLFGDITNEPSLTPPSKKVSGDDENSEESSDEESAEEEPPAPVSVAQLEDLDVMNPKTKAEFEELNTKLTAALVSLSRNPVYATVFLPQFLKNVVGPLNSEQVRKCASTLTTVSNEKLKEERAADKPKKGKKGKPGLAAASAKIDDAVDTTNYSRYDEMDDFM
ncbi:eukaryotic translation initiation factor 3 subunit J [Lipomyces arxii]|uniref:eukaryotic translation initiation factor 3 subunit J n=1 Tax=Lipomyces arxii TaxID=56418 RepID=UPI0034CEBF9C